MARSRPWARSGELGAAHVPRGQVAQRPRAFVLVLDQLPIPASCGGLAGVLARARLDRGLLVGAHDEIAGLEQLALPAARVEVEDPAGLRGELRVAREDPRAVV